MPGLAAFPSMMQRDRKREGLRECRAAWLLGITVRELRRLEAGEVYPDFETWRRMCDVFQWPRAFQSSQR
jgi:predicted transcriptional regulator